MSQTKFAYFEGEIRPIEEAKVSITCNTLHYGTGCFGGLRAYWNEEQEQLYAFRLADHYKRFLNSAKLLHCRLDYTVDQLIDITVQLLQREGWRENCYIRPIAYKDDGFYRVWLHEATDRVAITSQPVGAYIPVDKGASVCVSAWRRIDDTSIPARGKVNGTYVNSALAKSDAMLSGFDDTLLLNQDGHVAEGSAANFMMVRDGVVITPPLTSNVLEGITRRTLLELIREELMIEVVEREIDRSELYLCDEAFFCGTGAQVTPISTIDHRSVGNGEVGAITNQIRELYFRVVFGKEPNYMHWLTPVLQREAVYA
ncbi:MAG: branched-chain amino acid transaminase [Caldilineaceae bacterium]|nr:branched-chain amino acid transaminase [Caldilineaceae bacterium]